MRIAVDAMGGDHAPARPVDGALAAARNLGLGVDLVGREDLIRAELARHPDAGDLDVRVIDAPDVIEMAESPAQGAAPQAARVDSRRRRARGARSMPRRWSAPGIPAPAWSRRTRRSACCRASIVRRWRRRCRRAAGRRC